MENNQPSFIPRQNPNNRPVVARRKRFNLFGFLSAIIFMGSVALGIGAFIYDKMQSAELGSVRQRLNDEKNRFQFEVLDEIRATDNRLKNAQLLIDAHVSPSILLDILERSTQQDIQWTSMEFSRRSSGDVGVTLVGTTGSFNSVALQAKRFGEENALKEGSVIFTNLNKSEDGAVIFTVTLNIPKEAIVFESTIPEEGTSDMIQSTEEFAPVEQTTEDLDAVDAIKADNNIETQ